MNSKIAEELSKSKPEAIKRAIPMEERPSEERIIERLFQKTDYKYCLLLKSVFKPLLYKDRNFSLFVGLYDTDRRQVVNCKSMPLRMALYTSNDQMEQIELNKQNQPILKGVSVVDLTQGHASFQKVSVREVSSKFDRGLVHIVVSVEKPPFEEELVDWREVRPLVIKDVMIRAKKQN